jgi:hypothetical protein
MKATYREKQAWSIFSRAFGKDVIEGSAISLLMQSSTLEKEIIKHYNRADPKRVLRHPQIVLNDSCGAPEPSPA